MKKIATILIIIGVTVRVICCGSMVDIVSQTNLLDNQLIGLNREVEQLLLTNSELMSYTGLTAQKTQSQNITLTHHQSGELIIALSH